MFQSLWAHLDQDTRTMSMVDASLGLRASEFGLRWEDFAWEGLRVKIQRSWVYGRVCRAGSSSARYRYMSAPKQTDSPGVCLSFIERRRTGSPCAQATQKAQRFPLLLAAPKSRRTFRRFEKGRNPRRVSSDRPTKCRVAKPLWEIYTHRPEDGFRAPRLLVLSSKIAGEFDRLDSN